MQSVWPSLQWTSSFPSLSLNKRKRKAYCLDTVSCLYSLGITLTGPVINVRAGWPSGLRRWFKAPVTSVARVRISHLSLQTGNITATSMLTQFPKAAMQNWIAVKQPSNQYQQTVQQCLSSFNLSRLTLEAKETRIILFWHCLSSLATTLSEISFCTMAGWPSGLRRWFKAPVTSVARVRISHPSEIIRH